MKLEPLVDEFKKLHVLVIGDAIEDHYIFGRVDRICPEAPVPVLVAESTAVHDGGAAHTTNQVAALAGTVSSLFAWPKSVKLRYMVGAHMLMRLDNDEKPSMTTEETIETWESQTASRPIKELDALILSDYGKGLLDERLCQYFIAFAKRLGARVFVDPKGSDWSKYRGADWICPNELEWAARTSDTCRAQVLQKRGAKGLKIDNTEFPSSARAVFDVTGAGDVVVAIFAMAIAAGADSSTAAQLANIAAGWSVSHVGAVCIGADTLKSIARMYDTGAVGPLAPHNQMPAGRTLN